MISGRDELTIEAQVQWGRLDTLRTMSFPGTDAAAFAIIDSMILQGRPKLFPSCLAPR